MSATLDWWLQFVLPIFVVYAVGTPSVEDGSVEMSAVLNMVEGIAESMDRHRIIITKSTVSMCTHEKVIQVVSSRTSHPFDYAATRSFSRRALSYENS